MDKASVIGLITACVLILAAILLGGSPIVFVDPKSILIVIGGTLGTVFLGFPAGDVFAAMKAMKFVFKFDEPPTEATIKLLADLSDKARREGLLALERSAESVENPFLKRGLRMMADGHEAETIESALYEEIDKVGERHKVRIAVFDGIGAYAPAMGMIGTLIGLVQMLQTLSDPTTIGPAMAVALLTTLYGSLIANLCGIPMANKLKMRSDQEIAHMEMIVTGLKAILAGDNPRFVAERLNASLPPSMRMDEAA